MRPWVKKIQRGRPIAGPVGEAEECPPVDSEPPVSESLVPEPPLEGEEHEEEEGEKPLPPPASKESEDSHGGDEITGEVDDSPPRAGEEPGESGQGTAPLGEVTDEAGERESNESKGECEGSPWEAEKEPKEKEKAKSESKKEEKEEGGEVKAEPEEKEEEKPEIKAVPVINHDLKPRKAEKPRKGSGTKNYDEVVNLSTPEAVKRRRIKSAIVRILSLLTREVETPIPGSDVWDMEALVMRRHTRVPLKECMVRLRSDRIVFIMDTSGSCRRMAEFFSDVALAAQEYGGVEVYTAPNACLATQLTKEGYTYCAGGEEGGSYKWPFERQNVVFFGDFDGGDIIVDGSRRNKVIWFSCETRYDDMAEYSWCHVSSAEFRGQMLQVEDEKDLLRAVKRMRALK